MAKDVRVFNQEVSRTTTRDKGGKGITVVEFQKSPVWCVPSPIPSQGNSGNTQGRKGAVLASGEESRWESRLSKGADDRSANRSSWRKRRRCARQERERSKNNTNDNDGDDEM